MYSLNNVWLNKHVKNVMHQWVLFGRIWEPNPANEEHVYAAKRPTDHQLSPYCVW